MRTLDKVIYDLGLDEHQYDVAKLVYEEMMPEIERLSSEVKQWQQEAKAHSENYWAAHAENERLRDQVTEIPTLCRRYESKIERLEKELAGCRADDRICMSYLQAVLQIVGGADFPNMVERVRDLKEKSDGFE